MTQKEIKEKIMQDTGEGEHRARAYAERFCKKFGGNIRPFTYVLASYTPNGDIRISYVLANKRNYLIVNGSKPFSRIKIDQ